MNTNNKTKLGHVFHKERRGTYAFIHLTISALGHHFSEPEMKITWQTDDEKRKDGTFRGWYGFRVTITAQTAKDALTFARVVAKMEKALAKRQDDNRWELVPSNVAEILPALGVPRTVYDPRVSEYVPVDKVAPEHLKSYSNGITTVLASGEAEAQRKLAIATAQYNLSSLESWIADGKKVCQRDDAAPTVESLATLFLNPFEEQDRASAAQASA